MSVQNSGPSPQSRFSFPVVGIDASPDDADALKQFLSAMPARCGAAFVIVLRAGVKRGKPFDAELHPTTFLKDEHVLLVDDDHDTVETFRLLLEMEGAVVTVATSGDEALDMLDKQPPSLILSDLGMPGMNGLQFIAAVRKRPNLQSVKAIALSGFGRPSDIEEATHAGFDAHLTKPVMLDALLSTIARVRTK